MHKYQIERALALELAHQQLNSLDLSQKENSSISTVS